VSGWFPWGWGADSYYIGDNQPRARPLPVWDYYSSKYGRSILFPHWAPAIAFASLAAALGFRTPYQFSLRTLLILTTIVAAILGLVAWASGQ
jgi:hypothetical protein